MQRKAYIRRETSRDGTQKIRLCIVNLSAEGYETGLARTVEPISGLTESENLTYFKLLAKSFGCTPSFESVSEKDIFIQQGYLSYLRDFIDNRSDNKYYGDSPLEFQQWRRIKGYD